MENWELMYKLLEEIRDGQKSHNEDIREIRAEQKKQSDELKHQSKMIVCIKKDTNINTKDLTEHKEGVRQTKITNSLLKEDLEHTKKIFNTRINRLEQPNKFKKWFWNKYVRVFTIVSVTAGAAVGVSRLINYYWK